MGKERHKRDIYLGRAKRYLNEKNKLAAYSNFQTALKFDPTNIQIYDHLIELHKKLTHNWSKNDLARSLNWEMLKQALSSEDVKEIHKQIKKEAGKTPIRKIGLTGPTSCGKSTVGAFFEKSKIPVISADAIVHNLLKNDATLIKKIKTHFGEPIFNDKKEIDHQSLAKIVFENNAEREILEALIHPLVKKEIDETLTALSKKGESIVVIEIPLLFESGMDHDMDRIITVVCNKKTQFARANKNGLTKSDLKNRLRAQIPTLLKIEHSDYVIDNSFSKELLTTSVDKLLTILAL